MLQRKVSKLTLCLFVLSFSGVAWIATTVSAQVAASSTRAKAIQRIKTTGGWVRDRYGPHNRTIQLGRDFTDQDMPLLAHFPDTEALDMTRAPVTDAYIEYVAELGNLSVLSLSKLVTDSGIEKLRGAPVTSFALPPNATDNSMQVVASMPRMERLGLSQHITDAGLRKVAEMVQLKSLSLGNSKVTNEGLRQLSGLTNLNSLFVHEAVNVTGDGLRHLRSLSQIGYLELPPGMNDRTLRFIAPFSKLSHVKIKDSEVTDDGLRHLASMEYLNRLELGPHITDAGMTSVGQFKHLHNLDLENTHVTGDGLKHLQPSRSPSQLRLSGRIGDEGLAPIKSFMRLEYLILVDGFTNAALEHLPQRLEQLELRQTGITKEAIVELRKTRPRLIVKFVDRPGGTAYFD